MQFRSLANNSKLIFFALLLSCVALPFSTHAEAVGITNPIQYNSFSELFTAIAAAISTLIAGVATVMIIIAGILFLLSAGNQGLYERAKSTLLYAILGLAIGLGAGSIIQTIKVIKSPGNNTIPLVISSLISNLSNIIVGLGTVMTIISGIYFLFSFGSPDKMALARKSLTYAIIGIIVGLLAKIIVTFIQSLFTGP